ncbi:MAG: hypothetical protein ACLS70_10650 [[Clostridium] symbiosum]
MRKAILKKFIQLLFLALALNTFIFYVVTSSMLLKKTRSNMMFALETADSLFDYSDDLQEQAGMLKKVADMNQSRFTIVKKDGTVEVDTEVSNAAAMENHMEREGKGSSPVWKRTLYPEVGDPWNPDALCGQNVVERRIHIPAGIPIFGNAGISDHAAAGRAAELRHCIFCLLHGSGAIFTIHHQTPTGYLEGDDESGRGLCGSAF